MIIIGRNALAALLLLVLTACTPPDEIPSGTVDPADYTAFYLWSGVRPPAAMQRADAAYILWGELRIGNPKRIVALSRTVPTANLPEKWLVVRAERLDWGEGAYRQLIDQIGLWQRRGGLTGVQVDFDSSTGGLGNYAAFLDDLRGRLPAGVKLSATGLMDWPANASMQDLAALQGALDEIVIQTYRETTTIPDYARYLSATDRLNMPYKIALVEGGDWQAPARLVDDHNFRGYIVFLLGEKPGP